MAKRSDKQILSPKVYTLAEKLGAKTSGDRPLPKSMKSCPEFAAEFYQRIEWPKNHEYEAPDYDDVGLSQVSFGGPIQAVPTEQDVLGAEGKYLIAFGMHNGGNWILLFDGNDPKPKNPMIYCVDHEPGSELEKMCPLIDFLAQLRPAG